MQPGSRGRGNRMTPQTASGGRGRPGNATASTRYSATGAQKPPPPPSRRSWNSRGMAAVVPPKFEREQQKTTSSRSVEPQQGDYPKLAQSIVRRLSETRSSYPRPASSSTQYPGSRTDSAFKGHETNLAHVRQSIQGELTSPNPPITDEEKEQEYIRTPPIPQQAYLSPYKVVANGRNRGSTEGNTVRSPSKKSQASVTDLYFNETELAGRKEISNYFRKLTSKNGHPSRSGYELLSRRKYNANKDQDTLAARRERTKREVEQTRRRLERRQPKNRDSAIWYFGDLASAKRSQQPLISKPKTSSLEENMLKAHGNGPPFSFSIKRHSRRRDRKRLANAAVRQLAKIWRLLDTDGDGLLDFDKLRVMTSCAGVPATSCILQEMHDMTRADWARYGVDFDTYISGMEAFFTAYPLHAQLVDNFIGDISEDSVHYADYQTLERILTGTSTTDGTELLPYEASAALIEMETERGEQGAEFHEILDILGNGFPVKSTDL
eukprot:gb/GECG01003529.1/.p1 GENE.gb/GECG01003529.1/~~gb/GECG01003529.1/.p1  ORF type:complete len:494 (+),score=52.90 gb/GECG01003529.1/:1-1482(+)